MSHAFSREHGIWWVGVGRARIILKAPWNRPLFSERYGFVKRLPLGFGWRLLFRTIPEQGE